VNAVKQKDKAAVRALLQKRVNVNAPEGDGATALHWAAYQNDLEMVELLITAGANVNAANDLKVTPLALSSANGNTAIVDRLLKAGADPDASSESGVTPLMEAARTGSLGVVRVLLEHEANVNAKEIDRQQTALMWAVARKHPDVVKALLDRGADVHARTGIRGLTVMLDTGSRGVKTSRQNAAQIETGGSTALLFAAQVGDVESTRLLLAAGADVNDTAADGRSPLVLAAFAGNGAVVPVLLEAGANPDAADAGHTALHAAVLRSDLAAVKALLAKGANPNVQITKGTPVRRFGSQWTLPSTLIGATPLFVAAAYLELDIIRALAAAGADPSLALPSGTTPLLVAAGIAAARENRPSDFVRHGIVDSEYATVPRLEHEVLEAVRLLLDLGADVNDVNEAGDSALHAAASGGMPAVIQLLADKGAALDVQNKQGQTPLALTVPRGGRGQQPRDDPGQKAAGELLRKLGAKD
jgi:ankyrin repeat protein